MRNIMRKIAKFFVFVLIATVTGFLTPILLAYMFPSRARYGWQGGEYMGVHCYMLKSPLSRLNVSEMLVGDFDRNGDVMQSVNIKPDDFFEIDVSISQNENHYLLFRIGGPEISEIIAVYRLELDDEGKPKECQFLLNGDGCNLNRSIYVDSNADGVIDTFRLISNLGIQRFIFFDDAFVPITSTRDDSWWIIIDDQEVPVYFDGKEWVICDAI